MTNLLPELRHACGGLSQRQLAREAGVHHSSIAYYEAGERSLTTETMEKISNVLGQKLTAAYVAGLFDRHSSWTILKLEPNPEKFTTIRNGRKTNTGPINLPSYNARVRFTTNDVLIANVLKAFFGAGFVHDRNKGKGNPYFTLFAANQKASIVAEMLLPYLVVKRKVALDVIEMTRILARRPGQTKDIIVTTLSTGKIRRFSTKEEFAKHFDILPQSVSNAIITGTAKQGKLLGYEVHTELRPTAGKDLEKLEAIYQRNRKKK